MEEMIYIYKLVDPFTLAARYIGLTRNPKRRHCAHLKADYRYKPNKHLQHWIAKVKRLGGEVQLKVIETVPISDGDAAERKWIQLYRDLGIDILNATSGGEGAYKVFNRNIPGPNKGRKMGPMRPEHREKISKALKGKPATRPDAFVQLNKDRAGIPLTDEHKQRVSESLKGRKMKPESIAKAVEARKEKFKDPEYSRQHGIRCKPTLDKYRAIAQQKSADLRRGVFKTVCHNGHEYTEENTAWEQTKWGKRQRCKKCKSARQSRYKKAKRLGLKVNPDGTTRQVISESGS